MLRSFRGLESNEVTAPAGVGPIAALIREGKRWTDTILGYDVQGRDCLIGRVLDLIVDDQTGDVRYLVVHACGECSGGSVLLAPQWTHRISWSKRTLYMDFSQQLIQNSPDWPLATPLMREYEARLHDHYGRTAYWVSGEEADKLRHRPRGDSPETASVA
jgi:PRC-barrel domain